MLSRSFHFVPGHRETFFRKADSLGADVLVFDLEDGVPEAEKLRAVSNIAGFLASGADTSSVFVRITSCGSSIATEEEALFADWPSIGVVIPKVRGCADVEKVLARIGKNDSSRVVVLIEDMDGMEAAEEIAREFRPFGFGLGLEDFLSHTVHSRDHLSALIQHLRCTLSSVAMSCPSLSIDTVSLDLSGGDRFLTDCVAARSAGMTSKFTLHPSQIEPCHQIFTPPEEAIKEAVEIARAFRDQQSTGYLRWQGKILSPPTIRKSLLLAQAFQPDQPS